MSIVVAIATIILSLPAEPLSVFADDQRVNSVILMNNKDNHPVSSIQ
jgi:hypothetical protein